MKVQVLLVSGRSGSGKTATGNEMAEQLRRRGLCHAHIDGDNLDAVYCPQEEDEHEDDEKEPEKQGEHMAAAAAAAAATASADMFLANLRAMWSNYYHRPGRRVTRLILSGTAVALEADAIKRAVKDASATRRLTRGGGNGGAGGKGVVGSGSSGEEVSDGSLAGKGVSEGAAATSQGAGNGADAGKGTTAEADLDAVEVDVEARAVILTASDEVASKRLTRREVGTELPQVLNSSEKMARVLEDAVGDWAMRVDTECRDVTENALYILRTAGWIA
ncbi:Zeta toxin [Purpureocillium lavendulum]|uniref:Zeta toxin n=1 Tax=Purpureocillium lavendulum TaxID=1247861 RepID=A0AB34G0L5_9HYPO|nr:Zeta toxin [Purpureocillium lavendulum]